MALPATSSPAPASTIARWRQPARSPSRSRSRASSPTSSRQEEIGQLKIKISGCINACGHHHVGHIGILGLDKKGEEFYQITLGGSSAESTRRSAPSSVRALPATRWQMPSTTILETYLKLREPGEEFLAAYRRVGPKPFKEALYAAA